MQIIDTFSGIGGFSLAGRWMGWDTRLFCEIDPFCRKVLKKHWPNVYQHDDIKTLTKEVVLNNTDWNENEPTIIVGGFPCQPFSHAGKRNGESDDRYLWPALIEFVREFKPEFCCFENVAGLVSMEDGKTLEGIFTDLEGEGYTVESFIIPAGSVGAWHIRQRVWVVAYPMCSTGSPNGREKGEVQCVQGEHREKGHSREFNRADSSLHTNTNRNGLQRNLTESQASGNFDGLFEAERRFYDSPESRICRTTDGIPNRAHRIKGLGNAIVPQVALEIFKAIEAI